MKKGLAKTNAVPVLLDPIRFPLHIGLASSQLGHVSYTNARMYTIWNVHLYWPDTSNHSVDISTTQPLANHLASFRATLARATTGPLVPAARWYNPLQQNAAKPAIQLRARIALHGFSNTISILLSLPDNSRGLCQSPAPVASEPPTAPFLRASTAISTQERRSVQEPGWAVNLFGRVEARFGATQRIDHRSETSCAKTLRGFMDVEAGMNTEMDPGDIANRYKLRISAYLEISGQRGRNAQEPW
ncbi:hypothetical protein K432DRAFT_390827 [Lepidopterella palustris CBS 459.81]|uniref:Uncharacterized protein n=1 Tax=Lepidopterella palustris CBS 459.81 TaxID=1314670 RepID=A0A8E2EFB9_9PEZI|nr:hypothetical protein K432DRAFT_390827 [Lepidopterella palustris CBS 459.81]